MEPSTSGRDDDAYRASSRSPQRGQANPKQLIALALAVYNEFNSAQLTLDSHTEASLKERHVDDPDAQQFIKQVVYGMVRYRKFFGCLLDSFYHFNRCVYTLPRCFIMRSHQHGTYMIQITLYDPACMNQSPQLHACQAAHRCMLPQLLVPAPCSASALRTDAALYKLFCYLTIFRLQELRVPQFRWVPGWHAAAAAHVLHLRLRMAGHRAEGHQMPPTIAGTLHYLCAHCQASVCRRLVASQDAQKLAVLLRYLTDEAKLREVCREEWLKLYDKQVGGGGACGAVLQHWQEWCAALAVADGAGGGAVQGAAALTSLMLAHAAAGAVLEARPCTCWAPDGMSCCSNITFDMCFACSLWMA